MKEADRRIIITLTMHSPTLASVVSKAFQPEVSVSRASGSNVHISAAENLLTLCFETQSTATMRALINSYLRWVKMIDEANAVFTERKSK